MNRPVRVTDEAVADVSAAARWYAARSLKVADAFIDEVHDIYLYIEQFPNGAPRVRGLVRQFPLSRFPFVILYRPFRDHIAVLRVFHTSRDPKKKARPKRLG
ncbi:MAG: type II toxin-antitoxin system RelE/ParE family toxin [Flavobacteriales bacterium]|nr:type II toxin-antitoxin system RelE/ParE family toxin [Flavobacteriales bacterium]